MARKLSEVTSAMSLERHRYDPSKRNGQARAKLKSKARLRSLDDLDHRTAAAQQARDLVKAFVADLGNAPSTAQAQLAQRGALLAAMLEDYETKWVLGQPIDVGEYGFLVNAQRRVLCSIGADSDECGQLFRLKPDSASDRLRTPFR